MKKLTYLLTLLLALMITSCDEHLDAPSPSDVDEASIFSIYELAKGAIDGIKEPIGQTNSYRGRFLTHYGSNTDIEWVNADPTSTGGRNDLSRYVNSSENSDMNRDNVYWAKVYGGIERANVCIRGLRTYGNPDPGTDMGQLLGEALTLRAFYYADLLKAHGDIVERFEPITTETIYLPKSNRDVIYKQIIADLGEAENLVAWPTETDATKTTEDINKAFVKGLRARVCLMAAGYGQRADGIRRSNDPELAVDVIYPIALQECLDVIEKEGTYVDLEDDFETLWRKNCEEDITAGGESLWEIPFSEGRGRHLFTYAVRHQHKDQYTGQPRGGSFGPLPTVYYDYDTKDTRRDITCVPYRWSNDEQAFQEIPGVETWYFGKWRYEWMTRYVTSTNDDGVNKIYMRYAEVLLMAAEIENELYGPTAAAPYLKKLRRRAFDESDWSTKVEAYVDALTTKEEMFDAIVDEHGFEFCGEMERKQALIRWNLLKTKMDESIANMKALVAGEPPYSNVLHTIYYKLMDDGETLDIYGLNRGDSDAFAPIGYTATEWINEEKLDLLKIESLYENNPDENQFRPVWQVFINNSNGQLIPGFVE